MSYLITEEEPTRQESLYAWVVCLIASLFFFYEFVQLNMFNSINDDLTRTFSLDATHVALLSGTYFLADVIFLIPAGMILDRFSTRKVVLMALFLCIVGTFVFSTAHVFWLAALSRFFTGIGNAFAFLSCVRLASRWFSPRKLALIIGIIVTMAMLGGVVAQLPLTRIVNLLGWRNAMEYNAYMGLVIFVLIFIFVRDFPRDKNLQHIRELKKLHDLGVFHSFMLALTNVQNWFAGIYTSLLNLSIFIMGALWGTTYLVQVHHIQKSEASTISSMVFWGTIVGAPLIGWFSDKLTRRRSPMIIFAILSLAIGILIMTPHQLSYYPLLVLFFLLGFFTSAQVLSYPVITESNHPAVTSTAVGFSSVLIMGGGALFQLLFSVMLQSHWDHRYYQNVPKYTNGDFQYALIILPIAFAISLLAALFLREPTDHRIVARTQGI